MGVEYIPLHADIFGGHLRIEQHRRPHLEQLEQPACRDDECERDDVLTGMAQLQQEENALPYRKSKEQPEREMNDPVVNSPFQMESLLEPGIDGCQLIRKMTSISMHGKKDGDQNIA